MKSMSELSKPIPIRLMKETETDLRTLSGKTAIPFSALVRLAVQHGLPSLKQSLRISEEAAPSVSPTPEVSSMPPVPSPVVVTGEDPDLNLR
jgi:predicted DNA-binding protein